MNKISYLKNICIIFLLVFLIYLRWRQQIFSLATKELNISPAHFYGRKLADHYYTYSVLDFHRLEVLRLGVILFFNSTSCDSCRMLETRLVHAAVRSKKFPVILRVNIDAFASEPEQQVALTYRVSHAPTILIIDSDTNVVHRYIDLVDEPTLLKMFADL